MSVFLIIILCVSLLYQLIESLYNLFRFYKNRNVLYNDINSEEKESRQVEAFDRGLRWKELREKFGLSQQEVADRLGVTRSTISAYEGNLKSPRLDILEELAILYRTSIDYMLGMEKNPACL